MIESIIRVLLYLECGSIENIEHNLDLSSISLVIQA